MSSRTYKYDALAAEVKLKDITSCRHNRALLHRIKNNDPGLTRLYIMSDSISGYDPEDFVIRSDQEDLGWLGFFVGKNELIKQIVINHLPGDNGSVKKMFEGFQRSKTIKLVNIEFLHEGFSAMNLPYVTEMEVECPRIAPEGAKYLASALNGCKSLKQYNGPVTPEIVSSLSSLPMLESISVTFGDEMEAISREACAALGELVKTSTAVKELSLSGVGVEDDGLKSLASGLKDNRSLTELYLGSNSIGDQGAATLAASLAHTSSLELLSMSNNNIGDDGLAALASFITISQKLKKLYLPNNNIGDHGLEALASALLLAPNRSRLRSLSLDGNTRISVRGLRAITRFLQSRKCTVDYLCLDCMNIGEEEGAFLGSGLSSNKSLLTLSLRNASIDNVGMRNLAAGLSSNNSLQKLDLSRNTSITAAGLSHFKRYFQSSTCSLQVLDIYSINIGDEGALALVDALAHNKSLEKLRICGETSGVSVTGWKAFSKLLCDSSTPNSAYLSNHTLGSVGCLWGWDAVADEYQNNISPWLELNKNSSSSNAAAKVKVLRCFPDLNMTPLFQWDLKLLPFAKAWFQSIKGKGKFEPILRSRKLSAIYSFVRGMPVWVADDCKKYLTEQLNRLDATKRKLEEEIQAIEEAKRHLVEG